jgi:hypothetical protein
MKFRFLPFLCLILTVLNLITANSKIKASSMTDIDFIKNERDGTKMCKDRENKHPCN